MNGSHCSLKLLNFKQSKVYIKTLRCLCRQKEVVEESILRDIFALARFNILLACYALEWTPFVHNLAVGRFLL